MILAFLMKYRGLASGEFPTAVSVLEADCFTKGSISELGLIYWYSMATNFSGGILALIKSLVQKS
jgi:hypothetical protein